MKGVLVLTILVILALGVQDAYSRRARSSSRTSYTSSSSRSGSARFASSRTSTSRIGSSRYGTSSVRRPSRRRCRLPPHADHASVHRLSYRSAKYTCETGYIFAGGAQEKTVRCSLSGFWQRPGNCILSSTSSTICKCVVLKSNVTSNKPVRPNLEDYFPKNKTVRPNLEDYLPKNKTGSQPSSNRTSTIVRPEQTELVTCNCICGSATKKQCPNKKCISAKLPNRFCFPPYQTEPGAKPARPNVEDYFVETRSDSKTDAVEDETDEVNDILRALNEYLTSKREE